jgi:hypothetical protein
VPAHPEHESFNDAMFRMAVETLASAGRELQTSDLREIAYGPVRLDQGQRIELLAAYAERLKNIAGEQPFEVGIY